MPLIVSSQLPAYQHLERDGVPIIRASRAAHQDIRPLQIGLLNLMPSVVYQKTEEQFFRLLGNTPLQIIPTLVKLDNYTSSKVSGREHLEAFYKPFSEVKKTGLDALIITGANIENLSLEAVTFWPELQQVFRWADQNVTSTIYSCWSAYTALKFFHDIERVKSEKKIFGCYPHKVVYQNALTQNLDDDLFVPHSRFGNVPGEAIEKHSDLDIFIKANDSQVGFHAAGTSDLRQIFLQGHPEYDREDLKGEYFRDKENGQKIPSYYFPGNDDTKPPLKNWSANAQVFYSNWINWVYQTTDFNPLEPRMKLA